MNYSALAKNWKVQLVIVAIVLCALLVAVRGVNFGIEFRGGVRIPISIITDAGLSQDQMSEVVDTLKLRINKYGLSQAVVRPLGDREIIVEMPRAEEGVIRSVEQILRQQGKFEAVIDGKVALTGSDILQNAIGGANGERIIPQGDGYEWQLDFAVTQEAARRFGEAAKGKSGYPVYLFLDRPSSAAIVVSRAQLLNSTSGISSSAAVEEAARQALKKEGDDLELVVIEDVNDTASEAQRLKSAGLKRAILGEGLRNSNIAKALEAAGYSAGANATDELQLSFRPDSEMTPVVFTSSVRDIGIDKWPAAGLLSAPRLSPGLSEGTAGQFYQITGQATGVTPELQKKSALEEIRRLKSVISGGRLPVSTIVGSAYFVEPSLGEQFLTYSAIGIALAIVAVMSIIVIRYRRFDLVAPVVAINVAEIFLTTSIIGLIGTIDLATVAGIVAIIGTGVDDQIIVVDELLRRGKSEEESARVRGIKDRIGKAFFIIFTIAGIAVLAMLPLLLSGIVEMMGFALSTIIGMLVGVLVTRPAFGAIIEEIMQQQQ